MNRPTSIQVSPATDRQVEALRASGFGGLTDIVRLAIDRMYNQEVNTMDVRALTERELDWYPYENSPNCAIRSNGRWYYGDCAGDESQFLGDGDYDYIEVPADEAEARRRGWFVTEILVEYSEESLWGSVDPDEDGYNREASLIDFERLVREALVDRYPAAAVTFLRGINDRVSIHGKVDDEDWTEREGPFVDDLVGRVYADFEWTIPA